jgi:putative SOS response-associated peptidase YedK
MCGRISQKGRREDFREFIYKFDPEEDLFRPNIKPTQNVLIVIGGDDYAQTVNARWWFQKEGAKEFSTEYTTFNAAAEKLEKSFLWSGAFRNRRCIVPVTSFYEWNVKGEPPLEIGLPERDRPFALAGLWSNYYPEGVHQYSFTIITTDPNDFMKPIHRRMPVVLGGLTDQEKWLREGGIGMLLPFGGELAGEKLGQSLEKMYSDRP